MHQLDFIDRYFLLKKIGLSLSHLVPEIFGPKVGLIFHQNVFLKLFKHFISTFSLILDPVEPLFHWP